MAAARSRPLTEQCLQKLQWTLFSKDVRNTAHTLRDATTKRQQIPSLLEKYPQLDKSKAYEISAASCALAVKSGFNPVGRKIGFTNTKIWSDYNVSEPNWGYLWERRTQTLSEMKNALWLSPKDMQLEPRIEPEIIFCLKKEPRSDMTERELLSCVEWIAHGYEIVISLFKDWKFTANDTTAINALHNRLCIGDKHYLEEKDLDTLPAQLANFEIKLYRNRELVDTGHGSNVLGSPIKALQHLCAMVEQQELHPQLLPGEIITTGTLTKAMPIAIQETWSTKIEGLEVVNLNGQDLRIRPVPQGATELKKPVKKGSFKRLVLET